MAVDFTTFIRCSRSASLATHLAGAPRGGGGNSRRAFEPTLCVVTRALVDVVAVLSSDTAAIVNAQNKMNEATYRLAIRARSVVLPEPAPDWILMAPPTPRTSATYSTGAACSSTRQCGGKQEAE